MASVLEGASAAKSASAGQMRQPVSPLTLLAAVPLILGLCFVVSYAELVIKEIQIAICQFSPAAIGALLALIALRALLRLILGRELIAHQQLLALYLMLLTAAMLTSRGLMEKLLPALVGINYYATPENKWAATFYEYTPPWLVPFNVEGGEKQDVARDFYEGLFYGEQLPWRLWVRPLLAWSIPVTCVLCAFFALASLFRRQWVDNEKLAFPLVSVPLEITLPQRAAAFFRDPKAWVGFSIPVFVFTLNGLHILHPAVPGIPLSYTLNQLFTTPPLSDISFFPIYASFAAVGFSYFLPSQVLFSLWSFFLFAKFLDVVASLFALDLSPMPLYPTRIYIGYQVVGAYLVIAGYFLKSALPHLRSVWRSVWRGEKALGEREEALGYRWAFLLLLVAVVGIIAWLRAAGMSVWFAALEVVIYLFVTVLVMGRSVAEGGLLMTETSFRPIDLVRLVAVKSDLGGKNLTIMAFFDAVFTRDLRGLAFTAIMDGLKISDGARIDRRSLVRAMAFAAVVGIICAALIQLYLPYRKGAVNLYSYPYWGNNLWSFQDIEADLQGRGLRTIAWEGPSFFVVGLMIATFLAGMRTRFWWWPLHPLGYALCGSWSMIVFWFPTLVAWAVKGLILRYGGMKLYLRVRTFFLGLILGEFSMALFWATFSSLTRKPAPFFPWP